MKSFVIGFWLFCIILASSWAFFHPGMFYLHDFLHSARIAEMARAIQDGHFPIRWSENFGFGYGMPLFEFYAPLPYFVGALFFLVGVPILVATKALFVLSNVGSAIGGYLLGKTLYGRVGGLLAAAAIVLAPYRAVNLFVRGALSETWGIMAAVWIIYFTYLIAGGVKKAWIGLTLSVVVLFLSHNLLTLIFTPFALLLALIFLVYRAYENHSSTPFSELANRALQLSFSYVIAICMSLFYLLPAFVEKGYTKVEETIVGGYFDYSLHFVYLRQFFSPTWGYGGSSWGPTDGISFFLGAGQLLALTLSAFFISVESIKYIRNKKMMTTSIRLLLFISLFFVFGVSLLLTTQKSLVIWQSNTLLQFVQFPWRFLSVALIMLGIITPIFLLTQRLFIMRWLLSWLVLLTFFINIYYFRPESWLPDPSIYYTADENFIKEQLSPVLPDYLPKNFDEEGATINAKIRCLVGCDAIEITTVSDKTQQNEFIVQTATPSKIALGQISFPGWKTTINGSTAEFQTVNGEIILDVPAGTSSVISSFGPTPIRLVADRVSLGASILFILICFYYLNTRKIQ